MGYRRKNGWPATIREVVLEGLSFGIELALEEQYEEFQGFFNIEEETKKTYVRGDDGRTLMGLYCLGPNKEGFYQVQIRVSGRCFEYFYIDPRGTHSRSHAEEALSELVMGIILDFLDDETDQFVWDFEDIVYQEFEYVDKQSLSRRRTKG